MTFAFTLKTLRADSGLSLQQLAEKVGCSKAHLWELEHGKTANPSLQLVLRLSEIFEVSVSRFFAEHVETGDEETQTLVRDYQSLSQRDKDFVKIAIKTFKEWRK